MRVVCVIAIPPCDCDNSTPSVDIGDRFTVERTWFPYGPERDAFYDFVERPSYSYRANRFCPLDPSEHEIFEESKDDVLILGGTA